MTGSLRLDQAVALIKLIAGVGVVLGSLESLKIREEYRPRGLFSWDVLRTLGLVTLKGPVARALSVVMGTRVFEVCLLTRGVAAALLIGLPYGSPSEVLCLGVVFGISLITQLRNTYGLDGSDQMYAIVYGSLFLGSLAPGDRIVQEACLWFITLQACLAYATAGLAKLVSPLWRDGRAIRGILGTRTYGLASVAKVLEANPWFCLAIGWLVILPECAFPFAVLAGPAVLLMFLAWGTAFHFLNAVIMGLDSFFWSFLATYPALWYCTCYLQLII